MSLAWQIPQDLRAILQALTKIGRPRLVGGGVRDWLLGMVPKDFDVEVGGVNFDELHRVLAPFGPTDVIGRSFGVIKVRSASTGHEYDFSLPRRESKMGRGHRGFAIEPDPSLDDAAAAARRDFTVNAIAYDYFGERLIDPHGGENDLRAGILRHTSESFSDDPLRVLRGFQLAARFNFTLAPATAALCREIADTYRELPVERVWGEWEKWATKSTLPSRGLHVLRETNWLQHFPEVAALVGTPQEPQWHPEGDVFVHTCHCVDATVRLPEWQNSSPSRRRLLLFAVLAHDFGKPSTTVQAEKRGALRWTSPGHEAAGVPLAESFLRRIGAPLELDAPTGALVRWHLAHHHGTEGNFTSSQVRRLARKLTPANIYDLMVVMKSDSRGRPPLTSTEPDLLIADLGAQAEALALADAAPRPLLYGRHLISRGITPGPRFKEILTAAFEAQLDGAFQDEASATQWLETFLSLPSEVAPASPEPSGLVDPPRPTS